MLDYTNHYREIDATLRRLLSGQIGRFSEGQVAEIGGFLDASEYGLALEAFAASLLDVSEELEKQTVTSIQSMATAMGIFDDDAINKILQKAQF